MNLQETSTETLAHVEHITSYVGKPCFSTCVRLCVSSREFIKQDYFLKCIPHCISCRAASSTILNDQQILTWSPLRTSGIGI